jgi:hypothetical protein
MMSKKRFRDLEVGDVIRPLKSWIKKHGVPDREYVMVMWFVRPIENYELETVWVGESEEVNIFITARDWRSSAFVRHEPPPPDPEDYICSNCGVQAELYDNLCGDCFDAYRRGEL